MRTIAVVTVGRSDYGIYLPVLRRIAADKSLKLRLIVAGMHLSPAFGETVKVIEAGGFEVADRVDMLLASDSPEAVAKSMGLGTIGFAQVYSRKKPDMLLVLGDRFEMHAAVVAAVPFKIPVAHIHGGELTLGAIDDSFRHSITKMSHLHFVSTDVYARRIEKMGEEPWRVTVSGAPGLDNLHSIRLLDRADFGRRFGIRLTKDFLLVTYHPVTLENEDPARRFRTLLSALGSAGHATLFTMANADTGGHAINKLIRHHVATHRSAQFISNLGTQGYFSAMALATAMVGNSSSGIIEAASFKLPVVNIGNRQAGRVRGANVIDTGSSAQEILRGIRQACSPAFRRSLSSLVNPYGDGRAAERIVNRLKTQDLHGNLITKTFYE
jgi:UDP-N-acetylglucosamine 2-epimerase (non-hydrolysing)/GDP/UDP-N,N'-diacetylbacillosamine 2-epimerase (hydrolysing)